MPKTINIVITVNSPGEVAGWLKPTVTALKSTSEGASYRITVFIPPCTFASGTEKAVVESIPEVDLAVDAKGLFGLLLLGKIPAGFDPDRPGLVLFLGGDLTYAMFLGKKLRYPSIAYTEGIANWTNLDRYAVPYEHTARKLAGKRIPAGKIRVIGNLMLDAAVSRTAPEETRKLLKIGARPLLLLLPGSRPAHFEYMVPFLIQVAEGVKARIPDLAICFGMSPFVTEAHLKQALTGPDVKLFGHSGVYCGGGLTGHGVTDGENPGLVRTEGGIEIMALWGRQYDLMAAADLAVAIPGTNTFELAAFGTPAMIALPLTHPERVPLEGIPGLIGRIPGVGRALKKRLVPRIIAKMKYTAWPNRLAQEMVIPELRGQVTAMDVSQAAVDLLTDTGKRAEMSRRLKGLVGAPGAAGRLAQLIREILEERYGDIW
ncbi:MAG: hypothetical protein K6U80_18955 [Firmicutes bacterium]|nr:hypothetical protein [Bacillota bacterium]